MTPGVTEILASRSLAATGIYYTKVVSIRGFLNQCFYFVNLILVENVTISRYNPGKTIDIVYDISRRPLI